MCTNVQYAGPNAWYNATYGQCYDGKTSRITFTGLNFPVPPGGKVIITLAYNTTSGGPQPLGALPCTKTAVGCPYDSLNIGISSAFQNMAWPKPDTKFVYIGQWLDANGIYVNWRSPSQSCGSAATTGVLKDDTSGNQVCWVGFHPNFEVWTTGPATE